MKKVLYIVIVFVICIMFYGCNKNEEVSNKLTKELAYKGVSNYCHKEYDFSSSENNSTVMYIEYGNETETDYQIIFRSYTGAFVYFYVDKINGYTKIEEYAPIVNETNAIGTININDYLKGN